MANENLAQLAAKMVESHFNTHARIPPLAPAQAPYAFFSCLRNLQYIAGFYRKLSRFAFDYYPSRHSQLNARVVEVVLLSGPCTPFGCCEGFVLWVCCCCVRLPVQTLLAGAGDISHTPFFVVGQRLGRTSVQEVLEALLQPDLRFSHAKFMSAGAHGPLNGHASVAVTLLPFKHINLGSAL